MLELEDVSLNFNAGRGSSVVVTGGQLGSNFEAVGATVTIAGGTVGANLDAFDPAVPTGPPGASIERLPPGADTDTAADWWIQPAPSPGRAGEPY